MCMDGYAFNSASKTCDVCPEFCTTCAYSGETLQCSECVDEYTVNSEQTGCTGEGVGGYLGGVLVRGIIRIRQN